MLRRSGISALVVAAVVTFSLSFLVQPGLAQQGESVAVFVARTNATPQAELLRVLEPMERALARHGAKRVMPSVVVPPPEPDAAALGQLREVGQAFLKDLAAEVSPDIMLRKYEPHIARALALASAVTSDERSLLWSMCLLRVQLYAMTSERDANARLEEAVHECRLHFPDQRSIDKIWIAEVEAAFKAHDRQDRITALEVRSAPARCEVLVFGAPVGVTPVRVQVERGLQEVQVRCGNQRSLLHRVNVEQATTLSVRLAGDAAVEPDLTDTVDLLYADATQQAEAVNHAQVLAAEAGAQSFVLVTSAQDGLHLSWHHADGMQTARVPRDASREVTEASVASLFERGDGGGQLASQPAVKRRTVDDYGVGLTIMAVGLAGTLPVMAISAMDSKLEGPALWVPLTVAAATTLTGVTILWAAPFGKRRAYRAQVALNGVSFGGTF